MPRRLVAVLLTVVACLLSPAASQVSATASVAVASGTYTYDGPTLDGAGAAGPRGAGERWQPASFVAPLYAYDDVANVRFRGDASNGADKGNLQVNDSRRAAGALSETAGGTSTTRLSRSVATNTVDDLVGSAKPWDLQRTETLVGRGSQAKVDDIAASMRENGWVGDPIEVFQANGQNYIVNGHHRAAAARQAGIDVQYRVISQTELLTYYPGGVNQLVSAASEARPGRVR